MAFGFSLFNVRIVIDRGPYPSGEGALRAAVCRARTLTTVSLTRYGLSRWRSHGEGEGAIGQYPPPRQITGADTYFASKAKASPMGPPWLGLGCVPS